MQNMLNTCERFCNYTGMTLEPTKCVSYGYIYNKHKGSRTVMNTEFKLNNIPIKNVISSGSIRYLGIALSSQKNAKIQESTNIKNDYSYKLDKIVNSVIAIPQKIHVIRAFLIPQLDLNY